MEIENVYERNVDRKINERFKEEIQSSRDGECCELCHAVYNEYEIELDHIIPISLGGEQFNPNNVELLCDRCHRNKTNIDIKIINLFKKLHFIEKLGRSSWWHYISKGELEKTYLHLFNLRVKATKGKLYECFDDRSGEDFRD